MSTSPIAKVIGALLFASAVVVGLYFMLTALLDDGSTGYPVWSIIDWFMAAGVLLALYFTFMDKRNLPDDESLTITQYISVKLAFYATVFLTLMFFWNFSGDLSGREVIASWGIIDPMYALVVGYVGAMLLFGKPDSKQQ